MDENELRRKMQAGELAANNGTVMRTLAIAGCDFKFLKLKGLLLALAGGTKDGRKIRAVIPGGSSSPVIPGETMLSLDMDYDAIAKAGSMLGTGGVIVLDETRCMVRALLNLARFYRNESCGQCTPCREGTGWLVRLLERIEQGDAALSDLDLLDSVASNIQGRTVCALGDAAAMPVRSFLRHFRREFEYHIEHKRCPVAAGERV